MRRQLCAYVLLRQVYFQARRHLFNQPLRFIQLFTRRQMTVQIVLNDVLLARCSEQARYHSSSKSEKLDAGVLRSSTLVSKDGRK